MSQSENDTGNDGGGTQTAELSDEEYYELLQSRRRSVVFETLADRIAPVDLKDLATAVATRESGVKAADPAFRERVKISLHHNHLPTMADLGVLDYDPDATRIEACSPIDELHEGTEEFAHGKRLTETSVTDRSTTSFDALLDVTSDPPCRHLLVELRNAAPDQEIDPWSALESGDDRAQPHQESLPKRLYHVYLPKLETQGFIEWDREAGVVSRGSEFDLIEPVLALLIDHKEALPHDFPSYAPHIR